MGAARPGVVAFKAALVVDPNNPCPYPADVVSFSARNSVVVFLAIVLALLPNSEWLMDVNL